MKKIISASILVLCFYSGFTSSAGAIFRLPWNFNAEKAAYRIDVSGISPAFAGSCSSHTSAYSEGKIDFGLSVGNSIRAVQSGEVIGVNKSCPVCKLDNFSPFDSIYDCRNCGGGYGNSVLIKHTNSKLSFYAHLYSVDVSLGEQVNQGKQLGKAGNTGYVYGPNGALPSSSNPNYGEHLHFEERIAEGTNQTRSPAFLESAQVHENNQNRLVCGTYTSKNGQDSTPPEIEIISPQQGSKNGIGFEITVNLKDDGAASLKSVDIKVSDIFSNQDYSAFLTKKKFTFGNGIANAIITARFEPPNAEIGLTGLKIEVNATDQFDNSSTSTVITGFDGTKPILNLLQIPDAYSVNSEQHLSWEMSDNFTAFNNLQVWYEINGDQNFRSNTMQGINSVNLPELPDGSYHLKVFVKDQYGNTTSSDLIDFIIDNLSPITPYSASSNCTEYDVWQNYCQQLIFMWSDAEDYGGSGVEKYEYYIGEQADGVSTEAVEGNSIEYTAALSGRYYLRIRAVDNAGNKGIWRTVFVYKFDDRPPLLELQVNGNSGINFAGFVNLKLDAADLDSGISHYRYKYGNEQWSDWLEFSPNIQIDVVRHMNDSIVKAQVKDWAGNLSNIETKVFNSISDNLVGKSENYIIAGNLNTLENSSSSRVKAEIKTSYINGFDLNNLNLGHEPVKAVGIELSESSFTPSASGERLEFSLRNNQADNLVSDYYKITDTVLGTTTKLIKKRRIKSNLLPVQSWQSEDFKLDGEMSWYHISHD